MPLRFRSLNRFCCLPLVALLAAVPACGKKQDGGNNPVVAPAPASTDHFLFAHFKAKEIRNSPLFAELKSAFSKDGDANVWNSFERDIAKRIGTNLSSLESATVVIPDAPEGAQATPAVMLIMVADAPVPRDTILGGKPQESLDHPGFFTAMNMLVHFPDEKTFVLLHPSLVERYQAGFARDRSSWPMSAELINAAQEHTLYAVHKPNQWPPDLRTGGDIMKRFHPLLVATSAAFTIDLKDREFHVSIRGEFPNADAAGAGKTAMDKLIADGVKELKPYADSKSASSLLPAFKAAFRGLTDATVTVAGNEVTAKSVFKADFHVGNALKDAIDAVRIAHLKHAAQLALRDIGMGLHNYASANNGDALLISGMSKNGLHTNPNTKPLLSWRVAILPYIEQAGLYQQFKFDEPWDSEHNKKLIEKMPDIFRSKTKISKPGMTHLQQVIGPQCFMPGRFNIGNIPDGTMNTLAVAEIAEPVIWTKPDDLFITEKEPNTPPKDLKKKFGGVFENGFNVLMWDGAVRWIDSRTVSEQSLWNAVRPADGNALGADWSK